jgi:hypothetical protein
MRRENWVAEPENEQSGRRNSNAAALIKPMAA